MRRSKEDSLKTRQSIVLAARRVFARRGVSQTSIEHVAKAAGVTRGAVYGHFKGKDALFQCMREQVRLPLVDVMNEELLHRPEDPLGGVERYLQAVLDAMGSHAPTRDTFHILNFKCEYVGTMADDMERQALRMAELADKLETAYRAASRRGMLRKGLSPRLAALNTSAFLLGLIRMWLLDASGTLVRNEAEALVQAHVARLRP
ncbi:MAG TPA: TetR family transcriptional regulator [Usitatibacter sp.]|nr:TetR family transcriptional regulator [Usitatibacter sp.]